MLTKLKRFVFHGDFINIFSASIINKFVTFASNIILVRILSKADYGVYSYAYNIIAFILIVAGLGIPSGLLQILSENFNNKEQINKIYKYGSKVACNTNIILAGLVLLVALFFPLKIAEAQKIIMSMMLFPFFMTLYSLQITYLRSFLMTKEYAISNNINTVLISIFTLLGAYYGNVYGIVIGRYIAYAISIISISKLFHIPFYSNKDTIKSCHKKELLKISLISVANNGISELLYLLDIFIIGIVIADQEVIASYKVATTIPSALIFIPSVVVTYIYPYFAQNKDNTKWLKDKYKQLVFCMSLVNLIVIFPLLIFSKQIIQMFFGNNYQDAIPIFRILLINYFISGTFRIISGNILVTQRQLKFNFYVALFSGLINLFGNIIFISRWGAIGATFTTVLVVIVSSYMSTYRVYKIIYKERC